MMHNKLLNQLDCVIFRAANFCTNYLMLTVYFRVKDIINKLVSSIIFYKKFTLNNLLMNKSNIPNLGINGALIPQISYVCSL